VISEFISLSPGLPWVASILDEAALPSAGRRQRMATKDTVGLLPNCISQQFSRRSLPQTHFNKEKRK
jgi:hypothetical protein